MSARAPSLRRVEGLHAVLDRAPSEALDDEQRRDLLAQLVQTAREVPLTPDQALH